MTTAPDHAAKSILPSEVEARLRDWWDCGDQEYPRILPSALRPDAAIPEAANLETHWPDTDFVLERKMRKIGIQTSCKPVLRRKMDSVGGGKLDMTPEFRS